MWRLVRARTFVLVATIIAVGVAGLWLGLSYVQEPATEVEALAATKGKRSDKKADKPRGDDKREISNEQRAQLIARGHVWREPNVAVQNASLKGTTLDEVTCKFKVTDLGGTTPKFDCELESGEEIRVKYGNGPEVPAEAAATRLLKALGFGADDITLVRRLRCFGCPEEPFSMMKAVEITQAEMLYKQVVNFKDYEDFEWVAVERKLNAYPVETEKLEGWSFFELDTVDPKQGGAPREHVDALRLMAVLLAHWDNKSENQRLVCLSPEWIEGTPCAEPFLLMQDVGATFGPSKLDLAAWQQTPMWHDRATCTVSMSGLPFGGATFGQARITEPGRQFFARLAARLSEQQLTDLFTHARFAEKRGIFAPPGTVADWVRAFVAKVDAVSEGPRCPAA